MQVSLLESILDFQFEVITTHLADGGRLPQRSKRFNAHAYLAAPYGVYPTEDGYLALAMGDLMKIARLIGCTSIEAYRDPATWFTCRDEIQQRLAENWPHVRVDNGSRSYRAPACGARMCLTMPG